MRHFHGHARAVRALADDPNFGLSVGVAGQDAIGNWNRLIQRNPLNRRSTFVGHHLEVVGVATNHSSERDKRIKLPSPGEALECDSHFERTRYRAQENIL